MDEGKTTKEILEEKSGGQQHNSIYNPESTKGLVNAFEKWRNTAEFQDVRVNWHATPHVVLGSEIPRGLLYTPIDVTALDYEKDLGFPGEQPYARGIHANMYRGKEFTMIEQAKIKIVGHNCFKAITTKVPDIDVFRYPGCSRRAVPKDAKTKVRAR